jgi:hypothetical protein
MELGEEPESPNVPHGSSGLNSSLASKGDFAGNSSIKKGKKGSPKKVARASQSNSEKQ